MVGIGIDALARETEPSGPQRKEEPGAHNSIRSGGLDDAREGLDKDVIEGMVRARVAGGDSSRSGMTTAVSDKIRAIREEASQRRQRAQWRKAMDELRAKEAVAVPKKDEWPWHLSFRRHFGGTPEDADQDVRQVTAPTTPRARVSGFAVDAADGDDDPCSPRPTPDNGAGIWD